jgi:hypothetical protein
LQTRTNAYACRDKHRESESGFLSGEAVFSWESDVLVEELLSGEE